jgi:transposase
MAGTLYVGIDLGKGFHQVAMVNERKEGVGESYRIDRGRAGAELVLKRAKLCGAQPEDLVVTIESTGDYWRELVWAFVNAGCRVYLAQPKKAHDLRKFYADHTKTDITDAEAIARMPLVDEGLRPVWVAPAAEQTLLRLCRLRWKYRCSIADLKRRLSMLTEMVVPGIDGVMPVRYSKSARLFMRRYLAPARARRLGKKRLIELMTKSAWGKFSDRKAAELWKCIENAPDLGWQVEDLLLEVNVQVDELERLEELSEGLDERIAELYGEVDPEQRLKGLGGLGEFLAAALTACIGMDVRRRFPTTKHLVSFAGLAPRVKSSAGRTKSGQGITKRGNPFLRAWAYLGASCARTYDDELAAYYHRLRDRGKHYNVAICATAARLMERCYWTLAQGGVAEIENQKHEVSTG